MNQFQMTPPKRVSIVASLYRQLRSIDSLLDRPKAGDDFDHKEKASPTIYYIDKPNQTNNREIRSSKSSAMSPIPKSNCALWTTPRLGRDPTIIEYGRPET